jgi:hypothetical protein
MPVQRQALHVRRNLFCMKPSEGVSWKDLKENVYFLDGSLRDIYVRNITIESWRRWAEFVNSNYRVEFEVYGSSQTSPLSAIDIEVVKQKWDGLEEESANATIYLGSIQLKSYFFTNDELDNDLTPKEFTSIEDHKALISYLSKISKLLEREVLITEEDYGHANVLVKVNGDKVFYPWCK